MDLHERREALAKMQRALGDARERNRRTYGWPGIRNAIGLVTLVTLASAGSIYLLQSGVISRDTAGWVIPTAVLSSFALGLVAVLRWQSRGAGGAPADDGGGAGVQPSSPSRPAEGLREIDRDLRRTRLALLAEDRRVYTQIPSVAAYLDLIIGGSLLVPLGGACIALSIQTIAGKEKYDPLIWLAWALFVAGLALLFGLRLRRARLRRALYDALDQVGVGLRGRRLAGVDASVDWMNRLWAAAPGPGDLFKGAVTGAVAGNLRGYPVLVDLEAHGYTSEDTSIPPRLLVYVAALLPAAVAGGGEGAAREASIQSAGFSVERHPDAGLLARATPATVKTLRRRPKEIARLGPLIGDLVRIAEELGAPPASELT